ncbi:MAG: hypothetical protein ACR2F1_15035 [Nitrososphaeraceae archaeon]
MGSFTKSGKEILIALVSDCINYGFTEKEALTYIKDRLGKEISKDAYYRRKKIVDSGRYAKEYLSYFTRIGFVVKHMQIIEVIEMIQKDTIRDYLAEKDKPEEIRNKNYIRQLRYEIRENAKLLQELSLGTPIIAQIKAKLDQQQQLQQQQQEN